MPLTNNQFVSSFAAWLAARVSFPAVMVARKKRKS